MVTFLIRRERKNWVKLIPVRAPPPRDTMSSHLVFALTRLGRLMAVVIA